MRERIFQIVQRARPGDTLSHAYDIFIVLVAFFSIVPLMFRPEDTDSGVASALVMLDVVTVYILFLDYILRWMTQDIKTGKKGWKEFAKYPFTPLAVIDLLAILPSLNVLPESFKFLRVLRVTKIFRYSKNLTIVMNVLKAERNTLLSVLVVALMYIFVSGLVMFVNEPGTFDNFFDALYWATTALTTVGYGDVYPTTDLGKFISMASSLFGIAVIALPAGIITGGYLEEIRQCQEAGDAYFRSSGHTRYKGRSLGSYGTARAYAKAHPKVAAYAATMAACVALNEVLYAVARATGLPIWLDTTGTALAAILLEPAAGLIVGFANNLVLAVQMGNAGNLLYYCLSAITALVFGTVFARGKKITLRSLGWAALFLVVVESAVSCVLSFSLAGGQLTTVTEQQYGALLQGAGLGPVLAGFGALFIDKLIDTAAVFVLVMAASRGIEGSRIDPAHWFGVIGASGFAQGSDDDVPASRASQGTSEAVGSLGNARDSMGCSISDERYVLGIEVGGTRTRASVFTLQGTFVSGRVFDSPHMLADGSHAQLTREARVLLEKADIPASCVDAVGLAVPGTVAAEESLRLCPHIDLDLRSYKSFLHSLFPKASVSVLDSATAALRGEAWCGASGMQGGQIIAFVALGDSVGAGFMVEGLARDGGSFTASELGHLCVNASEDELCSCGKTGCLEQYASSAGLVRMARRAFEDRLCNVGAAATEQSAVEQRSASDAQGVADEAAALARKAASEAFPDVRAVLDAAARRDPAARIALTRFCDALGFGLAQIACLARVDAFVLGGELSERADAYLDVVRSRYRACAPSSRRDALIEASMLGGECGVYGAALSAINRSLNRPGSESNRPQRND